MSTLLLESTRLLSVPWGNCAGSRRFHAGLRAARLGKLAVVFKEGGGAIDRSIEQQAPLKDVARQPE